MEPKNIETKQQILAKIGGLISIISDCLENDFKRYKASLAAR